MISAHVVRIHLGLMIVGSYPLASYRQPKTIKVGMAKRKQIQPQRGIERAFGDEMRKARSQKKISQMALYKATGLDRTFISDLERGIQAPSIRTIFRVAKGIGIEPEVLIERTKKSRFFVFPTNR
jgi:ribosome-binding protein aMBF1 (putative translation factor)